MTQNDKSESWQPCPQGAIGNLLSQQKRQRRLQAVAKRAQIAAASVTVGLVLVLCAFAWLPQADVESPELGKYGGVSCAYVQEHLEAYHAGDVSADNQARIARHLEDCAHCNSAYEQLKQRVASVGNWVWQQVAIHARAGNGPVT